MMERLKHRLPELFSLVMILVVVVGLALVLGAVSFIVAVIISAIASHFVYKRAKRPYMWMHLHIQTICIGPVSILLVLYQPSFLAAIALNMLIATALVAFACGMYRFLHGRQFSQDCDEGNQ